MGDKLANMVDGGQPRRSRRLRDSATRDLDTGPGAEGSLLASPSHASARRSEVDVLSKATLMGDGQTGAEAAKDREGEAQGRSGRPV